MTGQSLSFAVLGGGVLGQLIALRLREAGHAVTILEAADEAGGLAAAWTVGDVTCDVHYHVILPGDRRLLALLDELGLGAEVAWARSRTGFYADGRLSPLNSGMDYLRLPALSPVAKARLAFMLMAAARIRDGKPLERIPVADWLIRWCGDEAFERLWRPLLRAKLGDNHERASAAFIWATIRRLYLARSAGAKTETLGFVRGGYARILAALRQRLADKGVVLENGCPVRRVTRRPDGFRLEAGRGEMSFDRVVSTLPVGVTARVCDSLSPDIAARLNGVVYQGVICATVALEQPLSPNYLTYLTDPDLPFTAIVETSALTGCGQFGGRHVVYLPRYVTQNDPFWDLDDDAVRARFEEGLRRVHAHFDPTAIVGFRVSRVRNVMAVPTIGYSAMVPAVGTNVDGLYIASSAQIVDGTLNVDATLGVVERALPAVLGGATAAGVDRTAAS